MTPGSLFFGLSRLACKPSALDYHSVDQLRIGFTAHEFTRKPANTNVDLEVRTISWDKLDRENHANTVRLMNLIPGP